jgi:hypothetical protein
MITGWWELSNDNQFFQIYENWKYENCLIFLHKNIDTLTHGIIFL